jgi:hypothetical protein
LVAILEAIYETLQRWIVLDFDYAILYLIFVHYIN